MGCPIRSIRHRWGWRSTQYSPVTTLPPRWFVGRVYHVNNGKKRIRSEECFLKFKLVADTALSREAKWKMSDVGPFCIVNINRSRKWWGVSSPRTPPPLLCDPPHEQRHHQNHPWESTWLRKQICERTITAFYYYFEVNLIIEKNDYTKKKRNKNQLKT